LSAGRSSSRFQAIVLALLAACASACARAGGQPARFASSAESKEEPRRPAGVAVDPAARLPEPVTATHPERGLAVLETPADTEIARQVVHDFMRAAIAQDPERMDRLLAEQAVVQAGPGTGRQQAQSFWRLRLSRLDYGKLQGQVVYRDAEMETYRAEDLSSLRPARPLGVAAQDGDVVVRVPIATPRVGRARLFGDEILFLLRAERGSFRIAEMVEEFQIQ
jgi:hypothetical protein